MFKLFKKPPEIPEELDFLAQAPGETDPFSEANPKTDDASDAESRQEIADGISAKRAAKEEASKKTRWPLAVAGTVLFAAVAVGTYYAFVAWNAPVPAEIPKGDIFAALASAPPSAAPPGSPAATQKPAAAPPSQPAQQQATAAPQKSAQQSAAAAQPAQSAGSAAPPAKAENPAPKPKEAATPDVQEQSPEASQAFLSGIFGDNPFVDLSVLRSMVTASASAGRNLPHIGANGNMALPEVPPPIVSPDLLPSPGEIRTPAAPGGGGKSQTPTMGGIIKSADGSAIAIMGDGTVLSEGDTYKGDRRVTFIGGEGIQFDDGDSIAFGQAK